VTPNRTQVDAGQEIEVTAVAEDAQTPADQLVYEWVTDPVGGTFTGQGRVVRWRAPTDGPVPGDYMVRVTVRDPTLSGTGTSAPVRVNDAVREMKQLADTFLRDFGDSSKSAEVCVRNFSDSCPGKRDELLQIQDNRRNLEIIRETHLIGEVQLNASPFTCTAPTGKASCALVVSPVEWISRHRSNGAFECVRGDSWLTGVYERNQWWLCDSNFFGEYCSGAAITNRSAWSSLVR
jgi:hypothetical protein